MGGLRRREPRVFVHRLEELEQAAGVGAQGLGGLADASGNAVTALADHLRQVGQQLQVLTVTGARQDGPAAVGRGGVGLVAVFAVLAVSVTDRREADHTLWQWTFLHEVIGTVVLAFKPAFMGRAVRDLFGLKAEAGRHRVEVHISAGVDELLPATNRLAAKPALPGGAVGVLVTVNPLGNELLEVLHELAD